MAEDIGFGRLPRGAKILWERVAQSRTLSLGFFFATGSRFDPPGKSGTAHLVEHLVFKGTQNYTASALARFRASNANPAASAPGEPEITGAPVRSPHT